MYFQEKDWRFHGIRLPKVSHVSSELIGLDIPVVLVWWFVAGYKASAVHQPCFSLNTSTAVNKNLFSLLLF